MRWQPGAQVASGRRVTGAQLAHSLPIAVLALHVVAAWSHTREPQETQWLATMKSVSELKGALADELAAAVRSVVERSDHQEVPISTRVVYGDPAKALVDESGDDRLLVVGSRGRGALAGLILAR